MINPDTIRAQMEGGIIFGLTAALYGEITIKDGRANKVISTTIRLCGSMKLRPSRFILSIAARSQEVLVSQKPQQSRLQA
jgi:hypothetical protein